MNAAVDYSGVQGLLRFGYNHMSEACFLLLEVADAEAARAWLGSAPVTSAVKADPRPDRALQVAFTGEGLRALGVPEAVLRGFSAEFLAGLSAGANRSHRLGDVGESDPSGWTWGGPQAVPHVLVMLYAERGKLDAWTREVRDAMGGSAFRVLHTLSTSDLDGVEPFGFLDGVSQPAPDWDRVRTADSSDQPDYGNLVALGEFLLGYPNEYGRYTDRPLVEPAGDPQALLPVAEDDPRQRDLGRDGTYLVLRTLHQDVRGFWQFLDRQAGAAAARRGLAEAMVGRSMEGEPLVPASAVPIPGVGPDPGDLRRNNFTYEADPQGTRCPFGAHVRRANPRNADLPAGTRGLIARLLVTLGFRARGTRDDLVASTRFHRILRRGREYGPGVPPEEAVHPAPPGEAPTGLHFICLNANISRQFEFVQGAWINGSKFNGLTEEADPLLGSRQDVPGCRFSDAFDLPEEQGLNRRLTGLPRFVTVVGGAYFFLPGLRALRWLARLPPGTE